MKYIQYLLSASIISLTVVKKKLYSIKFTILTVSKCTLQWC